MPSSSLSETPTTPWSSVFAPPPSQGSRGSSSSRSGIDRTQQLFNSMNVTGRSRLINMTSQDTVASPQGNDDEDLEGIPRPPASKRAVSTGAIGASSASSRTTSRSGSRSPSVQSGWEPGMALPPPPPGPPPSSSRSQSSNGIGDGYTRSTSGTISRGKVRQAPVLGTSLGPVPPTPADWIETDSNDDQNHSSSRQGPLHIDTQNVPRLNWPPASSALDSSEASAGGSARRRMSNGLSRTPAVRDPSAKGIRERRSESRNGKQSSEANQEYVDRDDWIESPEIVKPADLNLSNSRISSSRKQTMTRSAPHSGSFSAISDDQLPSAMSRISSGVRSTEESSNHSTPKQAPDSAIKRFNHASPTPPISAGGEPCSPTLSRAASPPRLPQKALPTPPLQHSRPPSSQSLLGALSTQDRPVSHILHLPNDGAIPAPLSPRRLTLDTTVADGPSKQDDDRFVRDATERHKKFLAQERAAKDDAERLHLFAEFIIAESSIRRGRYPSAWDSGAIDLDSLCKNLFNKPPKPSLRISKDIAPPIEPPSPLSAVENPGTRPETMWWNNYQPCLSPIASMSHNDEMSSRGRTPSRWWESQTGSGSAGRGSKIERSKRESKYMGVPLRDVADGLKSPRDLPNLGAFVERPSSLATTGYGVYGPNGYPPEKQGWHDPEDESAPGTGCLVQPPTPQSAALSTPELRLDISLFITLPPPYPRHHPAISNSHPDLAKFRNHVRSISDTNDVTSRLARYRTNTEALRRSKKAKLDEDRKAFMGNLRAQIAEGSVSFAEAAEAEEAFKQEQSAAEKDIVQSEFDEFQDVVMNPLREVLSPRISKTDAVIQELTGLVNEDLRASNPDQTQAEGDEQPELLEILTQLKWLFESREALHRELFSLEGQQNQLYEKVVTQPYLSQEGAEAKLESTRNFFRRDETERATAFETEAFKRYQVLEKMVEEAVDRGVEIQLSAFWDIAPNLLELLNRLPANGDYSTPKPGTGRADQYRGIRVPQEEVIENPSYTQYPEQYLWSLLSHAERSTYQFIENQVNLLCLQHEVRCATSGARCKVEEVSTQLRESNHSRPSDTSRQISQKKVDLEKHLTDELQERVATVENLWRESLGSQMTGVKEGVKSWLVSHSGWDEEMDG